MNKFVFNASMLQLILLIVILCLISYLLYRQNSSQENFESNTRESKELLERAINKQVHHNNETHVRNMSCKYT